MNDRLRSEVENLLRDSMPGFVKILRNQREQDRQERDRGAIQLQDDENIKAVRRLLCDFMRGFVKILKDQRKQGQDEGKIRLRDGESVKSLLEEAAKLGSEKGCVYDCPHRADKDVFCGCGGQQMGRLR